jgi:hypothetical protein
MAAVLASINAHARCDCDEKGSAQVFSAALASDEGLDDVPNDFSVATSSSSSIPVQENADEECFSIGNDSLSSMEDAPDPDPVAASSADIDIDDGDADTCSSSDSESNASGLHDNINSNEAEVAAISSSAYTTNPTPVLRTNANAVSSFFQREIKNDMLKAMRGKNKYNKAHERYKKRTEVLHQELLKCTAQLLLLDESEAIALTPILSAADEEMDVDIAIVMEPFLHQLSSKHAAFQIMSILLFNFLLRSGGEDDHTSTRQSKSEGASIIGYDARVRHAFKRLALVIFNVEDSSNISQADTQFDSISLNQDDHEEQKSNATIRKFENLENSIALKLLLLSKIQKDEIDKRVNPRTCNSHHRRNSSHGASGQMITWERPEVVLRDKLIRAASIVGAGLAAGAIFAVSGGLAAPGIAATVGMIAGSTAAATAAIVTLTGTIAMSTIFGVSGAGLVAAKVGSRTRGLTEFVFKRDIQTRNQVALSRTVCISGWIRNRNDFHRPWGITPEGLDKAEQLRRFFSIFDPEKVDKCDLILEQWKGREDQFWDLLRDTHGRDPDHLLPLYGPLDEGALNEDEKAGIDYLVETLGYPQLSRRAGQIGQLSFDCEQEIERVMNTKQIPIDENDDECKMPPDRKDRRPVSIMSRGRPWDFHATYGGELYTVQWEPDLLLALNDSMGVS